MGLSPRRAIALGLVLLALLAAPAPLLPPHALAEAVQSALGVGWKAAYFVAAMGVQSLFYVSIGVLTTLGLRRALTLRGRLLQVALVPWVVVGVGILVRSVKAAHVPVWTNAIVPVVACLAGVGLGLGFLYRNWKTTLGGTAVVVGAALWVWLAGPSSALSRATEMRLRHLVAADAALPAGDARFGLLLQSAFAPLPNQGAQASAIDDNRAAILALGIAVGDPRLARMIGLEHDTALVRRAVAVGTGATLRGREDWSKHFTVSAALAVLEHPFVGDAAGLMKEQLDALTRDTGFSFADMMADRAGVRFAAAATHSDSAARAIQGRLRQGFASGDFFPSAAGLPEGLSVEEFRRDYGGVGSSRYRRLMAAIEARLDSCDGLAPAPGR